MHKPLSTLIFIFVILPSLAFSQSVATFYTTKGDFKLVLHDTMMLVTAGNFIKLVNERFYDGVIFHRVIRNFVIQGGDATLTGGEKADRIEDEFHDDLSNLKGTISMANAGPNTGTSQFFINLVNNQGLDHNKSPLTSKHPVFGYVEEGFNVVQDIGNVATDGNDRPMTDVVMDSVRITMAFSSGFSLDHSNSYQLKAYPNPAHDRLWIESEHNNAQMEILDLQGRPVSSANLSKGSNSVPLDKLDGGTYIVIVQNKKGSGRARIVIR